MEHILTLKRGRGGFGYQQKRCFLKLQKDADRKGLFCSNVSTLLSMIVDTGEFNADSIPAMDLHPIQRAVKILI